MTDSISPLLATFAGALGGGANCFSGYPFDSVKVQLQASQPGVYTGPWHCVRHILRSEGVKGLYRGLSVPLAGGIVETGINYAVYTQCLSQLEGQGAAPQTSRLTFVAASAAVAGVVLSVVLSPAELVKCRLQMALNPALGGYKGPVDCVRHLLRTEGARGLARGVTGTMTREMIGNALFFTVYEVLRRQVPGRVAAPQAGTHQSLNVLDIIQDSAAAITCGGLAGMAMWATVLPIDVAKSRMQVARPGTLHDVSLWRNMQMLYRERGLRGMYIGLGPTMTRAFPANAAQWLVYELTLRYGQSRQ